ncbi:trans-aconitate 3-methyltransferase [Fusarium beomiforme]|uniref:Trans-aconitate 3-methyltransferase n=1 Tax=Fusarium beomiforme TaxID=44412 RepID=A0A9P5AIK4_9HYPO|nr:trans-aconitate 3-methyltransferase [Fusarium beomiforme]
MSQPSDPTFRAYSAAQGANYAQYRRNYNPKLYETVLNFHKEGSGQFDTLIDVGCGPGTATRSLAPHFKKAYGLDPSEGMISTARSIPTADNVKFEVSSAESLGSELSEPIAEGTVDVITGATCAHWFDMPRFWEQAAKALKPGGTVALWTAADIRVDPSMPGSEAIQAALDDYNVSVRDYMLPGNLMVRDLYRDLPLPWTLDSPVPAFEQSSFVRKEWCTGPDSETQLFEHSPPANLDMLEMALGTASPVTRWREAHPEAVGTEDDVVRRIRRRIEKILNDAGVEKGKEMLTGDMTGVLLLVRKKGN